MARDEVCGTRDAKARRRLHHQHLVHLRSRRFFRLRRYHGTKGAVRLLTKAAAIQYAPDKIRVNSIHPGRSSPRCSTSSTQEELQPLIDATPLKRGAQPEEVGWCAVFLASDEASFVTGSELVVDGGYTAQ